MALLRANYSDIRSQIRSGDLLAFAGQNPVSELIKLATGSPVSHVGVVLQSQLVFDDRVQSVQLNHLVESTLHDGRSGVMLNRLSERLERFEGDIWYLPLAESVRQSIDFQAFFEFLLHQQGKPYDWRQALLSAADPIDNWPLLDELMPQPEDFQRLFCSELIMGALQAGGLFQEHNASSLTPAELLRLPLFQPNHVQLAGQPLSLQLGIAHG